MEFSSCICNGAFICQGEAPGQRGGGGGQESLRQTLHPAHAGQLCDPGQSHPHPGVISKMFCRISSVLETLILYCTDTLHLLRRAWLKYIYTQRLYLYLCTCCICICLSVVSVFVTGGIILSSWSTKTTGPQNGILLRSAVSSQHTTCSARTRV